MWWELEPVPLLWGGSSPASAGRVVVRRHPKSAHGLPQEITTSTRLTEVLRNSSPNRAGRCLMLDEAWLVDTKEAMGAWIGCCDKYSELLSWLKPRSSGLEARSSGAYGRTGSFNQLHLCGLLSVLKSKLAVSERNVLYGDNLPATDLSDPTQVYSSSSFQRLFFFHICNLIPLTSKT